MTDQQHTPPQLDENHLIATRREKLDQLRAQGQAFPNDFRRDTLAEFLVGSYGERDAASLETETEVFALAVRLMAKRVMGKASFGTLQDMSGRIQVFVQLNAVVTPCRTALSAPGSRRSGSTK